MFEHIVSLLYVFEFDITCLRIMITYINKFIDIIIKDKLLYQWWENTLLARSGCSLCNDPSKIFL